MRLDGRFRLDGVSIDVAWSALSDPHVQETTLPGCEAVERLDGHRDVDVSSIQPIAGSEPVLAGETLESIHERALDEGDRWATRVEVGLGPATHRFDAIVEIVERDFPVMRATGRGIDEDGSFGVRAGMELSDRTAGVDVAWWLSADVGNRLGPIGSSLLDPVADRFVSRYATNIAAEIDAIADRSDDHN